MSFKEVSKSSSHEYSWNLVGVLDYSKEKCQYLVQKVHQNTKLTVDEGNPTDKYKKSKCPGWFLCLCTLCMTQFCLIIAFLSLLPSDCHHDHVCMLFIPLCCIGVNDMLPGAKYWVPRIRLLFSAEDPRVFVERIQFALHSRENTEALLLYRLSVDCMPIWRGTSSLDTDSLQRIKRHALSAPGLRLEM